MEFIQSQECGKICRNHDLIGNNHAPLSVTAFHYNVQALPTLQFVAQMIDPPRVGLAAIALADVSKLPAVVAVIPSAPIAARNSRRLT